MSTVTRFREKLYEWSLQADLYIGLDSSFFR